ncbi:hypothetical protein [Candidatus Nitrosacidococcus tergens]|uniref:Uncharacterized protein n=1 Tax=Candidatus Nitrosacidococcus tergens TaxID=553981 RepID=A0A7G1Q8A5_9GAMM|nr:hypothetical protein [Candidatus Nitrosacidococcus tergens]CAB1274996.1 conserved protein of unknown function [Candidatus Nitrosacidococcus tergens]
MRRHTLAFVINMIVANLIFVPFGFADKHYSADELNEIMESGRIPLQDSDATMESENMIFSSCKSKVDTIIGEAKEKHLPSKIVMSSDRAYIAKVWTEDAAITYTCQAKAGKLMTSTSHYHE